MYGFVFMSHLRFWIYFCKIYICSAYAICAYLKTYSQLVPRLVTVALLFGKINKHFKTDSYDLLKTCLLESNLKKIPSSSRNELSNYICTVIIRYATALWPFMYKLRMHCTGELEMLERSLIKIFLCRLEGITICLKLRTRQQQKQLLDYEASNSLKT